MEDLKINEAPRSTKETAICRRGSHKVNLRGPRSSAGLPTTLLVHSTGEADLTS